LKRYQLAKKMYEQVIEKYPEELRADNALFELAQLNEYVFGDKDTAKDLYEKLFLEYDNSTLAVEARKKYRLLNGDNVQ
jgi:TolA-binding protein